jgi:rhamnulokinase
MDAPLSVAVDLGAGSGRVFLAELGEGRWRVEELRRFHYPPAECDGHLRWDLPRMLDEIEAGLHTAGRRAAELGQRVSTIGVDSWGVDYGLVDAGGALVERPICYRDGRTAGVMEDVFRRVPREEIVARTGVQCLPINTIYQLAAHVRDGLSPRAARLLLIPDLVHAALTSRQATEFTNATTTQLIDHKTGTWDLALADRLGLPTRLFPDIVSAGTPLGPLLPARAARLGLPGALVVAPATHDTGSAVAGTPLREGWAYISSGTWSLVGVERPGVLVNADVARHNFTNEGGAFGTTRLLKNVMGLWILEACRREWEAGGLALDYDDLLARVAALPASPAVIYPDDPRLLNPPGMTAALESQLRETGQRCPSDPVPLSRVILDSLALRYASVLRAIAALTGEPIAGIHIVGGGSRNGYLNQATATATGCEVAAGPSEATVIGNAVVQAVAQGRFQSLRAARDCVAGHVALKTFTPRPSPAFEAMAARYADIEAQYSPA